jgi:LacI family transcriptional regulator
MMVWYKYQTDETMSVNVRVIAKRAGVSPMTVSRVINGAECVRESTREKVERAIQELEYVPNRLARGLASKKTATLGLIVPDVVNPFFTLVLRGAEAASRRAGYRLLVCDSENDPAREREYIDDLISYRIDGLMIAPASERSRAGLQLLQRRRFPFVLIDRFISGLDCDQVRSDNIAGARRLTDHLIRVGHRRIAHLVDTDETSTGRERLQGYREALEAAGIAYSPDLLFHTTVDRIGGYRAVQAMFALDPLPTAIFAVNNMTAVGAMQALRERSLNVPKDIGLVCFDDVEHLAVLSPFLSVMDQPAETFGTLAAQLLVERIAGQGGEHGRSVVLQSELIVRESCCSRSGIPTRPRRG